MVQTNRRAKNRLFTVKGKRYFDIKNVEPSQENRVQVSPWTDPNIPLEVTDKIFEYLTWKRVNKFKEVLTTAKTYIEQNKVHLCFKSTMERLNEITKQINGKENRNKKMFRLKNQVKFRVTGEGEWKTGYIVKTTPKSVFVVLGDEVFTVAKPVVKMVKNMNAEHMNPFVGKQTEDVQNWVWINIRNGKLWEEH
jgi:hypothetical protein